MSHRVDQAQQRQDNYDTYKDSPINIGICIFLLSWIVFISYPLFIYSFYQFYKYHKELFFQKRGVILIILQTMIMFILNCIIAPIEIITDDLQLINHEMFRHIIEHLLDGPLLLALTLIFLDRIWLLNFKHQIQLQMAHIEWKQQLSSFSINSTSFYTKYKNTLGSLSWTLKIFGSCYILLTILIAMLDFVIFSDSNIIDIVGSIVFIMLYVVSILLMIIIWFKFPSFKDRLFIRNELKESILFVTFIIFSGIIFWIIAGQYKGAYNLVQFQIILSLDGLCYIAILRVVRLNTKSKQSEQDIADLAENMDEYKEIFTMNRIIAHKNGYSEFMNFLVQFSVYISSHVQINHHLQITHKLIPFITCYT